MEKSELEKFSYSKLDLLNQCNKKYELKYIEKNYSSKSTIPLKMGSLLHEALENKCNMILRNEKVNYESINDFIDKGVKEIKAEFPIEFYEPDNASGMNYDEKIKLFKERVLSDRINPKDEWKPICAEQHFSFVFNNKVIIHGYIDRVDMNTEGDLKVIDYKTSKKVFPDSKLKTPLQMFVYDLACYALYGKIPIEHEYDFICIDTQITEKDGVCTKGYFSRGLRKLMDLLEHEQDIKKNHDYAPNATPLCYWCDYAGHTPNADPKYKGMCPYYLLWTPDKKTFKVNRRYDKKQNISPSRKFVF